MPRSVCRLPAAAVLFVLLASCDTASIDLGQEITLASAVNEAQRPVDRRDRFSFEDEVIHVHLAIPPQRAGAETRDFHFEFFDGDGRLVYANGRELTRTRADWLVASSHRINPELDAAGMWAVVFYVDGRRLDRISFPVTETADSPLPDSPAPGGAAGCCRSPGPMSHQIFLAEHVDEETLLVSGRRERFSLSDERMYLYLRLNNVPNGEHELSFDFYDGAGEPLWRHEQPFTVDNHARISWVWRELRPGIDVPGIWAIDISFDDSLLGSLEVPVDP